MNKHNVPSDKRDAEIHLKARRTALLELDEQFEALGLDVDAKVLKVMISDIEEINKLLEA